MDCHVQTELWLLMQRCFKTGLMRDCRSKRSVLDQSGLSVRKRSVSAHDLFCPFCVQLQVANTLISFHIITFSPPPTPHCAPLFLFLTHAHKLLKHQTLQIRILAIALYKDLKLIFLCLHRLYETKRMEVVKILKKSLPLFWISFA